MNLDILRLRRTNLYVYWDTRIAQKVKNLNEFETKIKTILGCLSDAQMGLLEETTLDQRISCKHTFKVSESACR